MNGARALLAALAAILLGASLAACAAQGTTFVSQGNSYTAENVMAVLDEATAVPAAGEPADEAVDLRRQSLVSLRKQGGEASEAADILTTTFANSSPGVPFYVERASFDGVDALIVAEIIGPRGGVLKDKRVWVIDDEGDILFSGTR